MFGAAPPSLDPPILPPIGAEDERARPAPEGSAMTTKAVPGGKITAHFSWTEAVGDASSVPGDVHQGVNTLAIALEALRRAVGSPLAVRAWYTPGVTHADGDVSHSTGLAADLRATRASPATLAEAAWRMGFAVVAILPDGKTVHVAVPPAGVSMIQGPLVRLDGDGKTVTIKAGTGRAVTAKTPLSASTAAATGTTDERRWSQADKLASLDPRFRPHVEAIMTALRAEGWQPTIVYAWRSPETQARLKAAGRSKVSFSFHNAIDPATLKPAAQAADVVDKRYGWGTVVRDGSEAVDDEKIAKAAAFFKRMGALALARGIHWGGSPASGFSVRGLWGSRFGLGWDPAHLQLLHNRDLAAVRKTVQAALARQNA